MPHITVSCESWPLIRPFAISRGVKTQADVVVVEITDGAHKGRGEGVPYPRFGETVAQVVADIEALIPELSKGLDRGGLAVAMGAGAARNAVDCALWDLQAKKTGQRAWQMAGLETPKPITTAETISLGSVSEMAEAAKRLANAPLIKVKLNGEQIVERMQAVHQYAPRARLIVDPNEGWTVTMLEQVAPVLKVMGVEMIEQPVPAEDDDGLKHFISPIPLCADEACHTKVGLSLLAGKYQMINIKLDKTGGLTEALALAKAAQELGFGIMVGCMVGTSLAMAPAQVLGQFAAFVDLDGPLLLKEDRQPGLKFEGGLIHPPKPDLWG